MHNASQTREPKKKRLWHSPIIPKAVLTLHQYSALALRDFWKLAIAQELEALPYVRCLAVALFSSINVAEQETQRNQSNPGPSHERF